MEKFIEIQTHYAEKLEKVQEQKQELRRSYYEAQTTLKNAQYELVESETSGTKQTVTKSRQKMNELHQAVKELEDRETLILEVLDQKLTDLLPVAIEDTKKADVRTNATIEELLQDVKQLELEIALKFYEMYEVYANNRTQKIKVNSLATRIGQKEPFGVGVSNQPPVANKFPDVALLKTCAFRSVKVPQHIIDEYNKRKDGDK
jgi:chromosome segregation ATPase